MPYNLQKLFSVTVKNLFNIKEPIFYNEKHLEASIDWLLEAHKIVQRRGFSRCYSLINGWDKPYPETTGYIIPTLLNFTHCSNYRKEETIKAVIESGEWLISIQNKNGSFFEPDDGKPIAFDTGQILFGLCVMYKYTKEERYLEAINNAAIWLSEAQEKDGYWERYSLNNLRHSYCSRVSWALLEAYQITGHISYKEKAQKHLEWVMSQQQENGWFKYSYFLKNDISVLHTITYTLRGLIECGLILNNQKYINSAKKTADILLGMNQRDILGSFYDKNWLPRTNSKCLPGLSQIAIVWLRLYERINDSKYLKEVSKIINFLKSIQNITTENKNLKGAISGSHPIYGKYASWIYPNWSVKFFIDLLIWEKKIKENINYIIYQG